AFCAARLLLIPDSNVSAANISSVCVVRNDICCSYVERVDPPWVELCVHVTAAVRWRKANDAQLHVPHPMSWDYSRLRLLNDKGGSFNKTLSADIRTSSERGRRKGEIARGARILVGAHRVRMLGIWLISGGMRCRAFGFHALDSPPGPHSPIGRGSGLKIRPVSVRVRLGALHMHGSAGPRNPVAASHTRDADAPDDVVLTWFTD